jgi:hypothetical protein
MDDRWSVYGESIAEDAANIKTLRELIVRHIKSLEIGRAKNLTDTEDYEITNVKITIKKKRR